MKRLILGVIAIAALVITGCGGGGELLDAPEITTVIMDETSVTVVWTPDTAVENSADFSGYNIYVATDSTVLLVEDGENLNAFNTTPITVDSFEATGLAQDSIYFIQVRTLNTDDKVGDYNATKPFVKASPRPEFMVTVSLELADGNQNETDCGLLFSTGTITSESLDVFPGADVFFERYTDTSGTVLQVNSASRRTATGFTPRTTLMVSMGQGEFDSLSEVDPTLLTEINVPFVVGDLIAFVTEENNYVKLHVDAYDETGAKVDVTYAYQDNADFPFFGIKK